MSTSTIGRKLGDIALEFVPLAILALVLVTRKGWQPRVVIGRAEFDISLLQRVFVILYPLVVISHFFRPALRTRLKAHRGLAACFSYHATFLLWDPTARLWWRYCCGLGQAV